MGSLATSSHAMLRVFTAHGIDRVFLVPGESYLGILDALADFPEIDVVTCRHEAGAGFMACADGRLTRRPGVVMVSRGPGASNAAIAVHTAQQDAVALILVVGQVPKASLRREAFQEIDYAKMFGSIAKWVVEVTEPEHLAEAAYKAVRIATTGTPGPVVLVVPEDVQQQTVAQPAWQAVPRVPALPARADIDRVAELLANAQRPLVIAGGALDVAGGRAALQDLAEHYRLPVAVSFRQHDLFANTHPLFVGDLGLANPGEQIEAFDSADLILALGTRLGDITTQGYTFPQMPKAAQTLVHVYPDAHPIGLHVEPEIGIVGDPALLARALVERAPPAPAAGRDGWIDRLRAIHRRIAAWPAAARSDAGVSMTAFVARLAEVAPHDAILCLDAGSFAAPVYRHFPFEEPQRLMAPLAGAMGYGVPAAIACALRHPERRVICLVGDGGFLMTGSEMIAAVERRLPIVFVLANNDAYGSIRAHQDREYPGRHVGTTLTNPDFVALARAFGVAADAVTADDAIGPLLAGAIAADAPRLLALRLPPPTPG